MRIHAVGCVLLLSAAGCQKAAPKAAEVKPPEVFFAYPTEQTVTESELFTGRTMAVSTVEIRSRVTGYLDQVFFKDGADVEQGAELFLIDPRSYESAAARAAATVAQSQSRFDRLERQFARSRKLIDSKAITQEEFDVISFDREEARATLDGAKADEQLARLNLSFTKVLAPTTGRISRRLVDPGNLVKADDTPLTTIVSMDPMYAYFDVDERTLLRLRRLVGEGKIKSSREKRIDVEIALADQEDFPLTGTINFADNQVEATTGTLRVRAVIDNANRLLSPGMFVRVRLPVGDPHPAMLVREESLGSDQGQRFVYVVTEQDDIAYHRVKVGLLTNGLRVIDSGLSPKDRVVVTGLQRVRPKMKVAPKAAPAAENVAQASPNAGAPGSKVSVAEKKGN